MTKYRSLVQERYHWGLLLYLLTVSVSSIDSADLEKSHKCGESGQKLKYIWGDALTDSADCIGPNNIPYPLPFINRTFRKNWASSMRTGRSSNTIDPLMTKKILLENYENSRDASGSDVTLSRNRRDLHYREVNMCQSTNPTRLCKTRYNTTAPMYGVSLTSGQPVTIVQKFPDLLQQVIYEVCESNECDVVHGECTQTFVPYLFLVIPLGPVTLTGQDYVLVESGCVCKPKYPNSASKSMSALPTL